MTTIHVRGACPHDCPDTCAWTAQVDDGVVTGVHGDRDHPVTAGHLCVKMQRYEERTYHPDRLLVPAHPLRNEGRRRVPGGELGRGAVRRSGRPGGRDRAARSVVRPPLLVHGHDGRAAGLVDRPPAVQRPRRGAHGRHDLPVRRRVGVGAHLPERLAGDGHRDRGRGRARGGVGGQHGLHPPPLLALLPAGPEAGRDHRLHRPRPDEDGASGRPPPRPAARQRRGARTRAAPRHLRRGAGGRRVPGRADRRRGRAAGPRHGVAGRRAPPAPRACRPTPSRTSPAGWPRPGRPSSSSARAPSATPTPARRSGRSSACPPSPARGATRAAAPTSTAPGPSPTGARPWSDRTSAPTATRPGSSTRCSSGERWPARTTTAVRSPRCASPTPTPRS